MFEKLGDKLGSLVIYIGWTFMFFGMLAFIGAVFWKVVEWITTG